MLKYSNPLKLGSKIAISAVSAGVPESHWPRLDLVIANLKSKGFEVIVGESVRQTAHVASLPVQQRVAEFTQFLLDDSIDAIFPPWGGEIALDLFEHLDFELLKTQKPKWLMGYSDVSTVLNVISVKLGWATVHGTNLMEMIDDPANELTSNCLVPLKCKVGDKFEQVSSNFYQESYPDVVADPSVTMRLTEKTYWKSLTSIDELQLTGRLYGGVLDALLHYVQTPYFDLNRLAERHKEDILLYLENAELSSPALFRALKGMVYRGAFDNVTGVIFGRNAAPDTNERYSYRFAIEEIFKPLGIPVVFDADIGHKPPNMTLINGALAHLEVKSGKARLVQELV